MALHHHKTKTAKAAARKRLEREPRKVKKGFGLNPKRR